MMTTETISMEVKRIIEDLAVDHAGCPVELLFVGERSVWLIVDTDRIEGDDALIDVFRAIESIPGVRTLFIQRADAAPADHI